MNFPLVTVRDMVRAQAMLLDAMGIGEILCVIGGSMGGMQVLQWAASYPERVVSAVPIATAARHSAQNIAFHEVGRQAILADPDWKGGAYQHFNTQPSKGLAVARMAAHITYLSEAALQRKFDRNLQDRAEISFGFDADFRIESYLRHQGTTFVDRFDANSYLYLTRAMDYFDLAAEYGGKLAEAFRSTKSRFCIISFTSDWLFPDGGEQAHRACAECRRGKCELRRNRDRSRSRRLPAERAGDVRHRAGIFKCGCVVASSGVSGIRFHTYVEIHPPLEGGSKNSSAARHFSGRGISPTSPRPENSFGIFDPPSRGGWDFT